MEREAGLKVVDALDLDSELVALLRPGGMVEGKRGDGHRLPRYFYEVPSREAALEVRLTPHFGLNEFLLVDLKEAGRVRTFPRYLPCGVRVLAFYLERLRDALGASIHLAVNGGYRSPAHKLAVGASPHMWGTAADIYKVGNVLVRDQATIETYNRIVEDVSDDLWVMPFGHEIGTTDDHIHLDLGYLTLVPREIAEDAFDRRRESPRFAFEERRSGDRRGWPAPGDLADLVRDRRDDSAPE
jgi:peptidase M15-like protein